MKEKRKIVTTNVRLSGQEITEYRILAAELGISFNDLVKRSLKVVKTRPELVTPNKPEMTIWDLPKLADAFNPSDEADWSEDDKIIYDIP